MTQYPFVQGIDYGPRKGTLGLAFHMAEGGDGTVRYLTQRMGESRAEWIARVRGVSANAVIQADGTVVNMVPWQNASGSMNPKDRGPATGYYNAGVLRDVLGSHFGDPNAWSISCEITGFRKDGPTTAQTNSAIAWGRDMAARFPTLRGAYGHADQTSTKGCPGLTSNMRRIFDALGGHGLWVEETDVTIRSRLLEPLQGVVTVSGAGHALITFEGRHVAVPDGQQREVVSKVELLEPLDDHAGDRQTAYLVAGIPGQQNSELAYLLAVDGKFVAAAGADIVHKVKILVDEDVVAEVPV